MTALRQRAMSMLEKIPEEQVEVIIRYMENVQVVYSQRSNESTFNRAQQAYRNLEKYFGRITESIDYKRDLEEVLTEKYESID